MRPDAVYRAAFVTGQGVPEGYVSQRGRVAVSAIEALRRYLRAHDPVEEELRGTVVAV